MTQPQRQNSRRAARQLVLAAALAFSFAGLAQAADTPPVQGGQPGSGRAPMISKDKAAARAVAYVHQGQFSYVRIETREPGAEANQHPFNIPAANLQGLLAGLKVVVDKPEPLFDKDELNEIVPPLVQALGRATPEQEVSFAVSGRHGYLGAMSPRAVTTGRLFHRGGKLELIIGYAHKEFEGQFRATGWLMPFEPGQRKEPVDKHVKISLDPSIGIPKRADWLVLNPEGVEPVPMPKPVVTPSQTTPGAVSGTPAARSGQPAVSGAPASPAVSGTPAAPASADSLYQGTSERLKALQKLRDNGLITEQEYQEKRKAILKDL